MDEMLDSKKLLYIFPDVAYLAEGLPTKKPHSFAIHSFTQINGNFLNDDSFLSENIQKLFGKLEAGETYHIILPDFLFTSTIVSIKEKSDSQIKEELQSTTFPQMGISKDTHLIDSSVLNEIRGTSRVQISAIEKDLLAPLRVAMQDHSIAIAGISPLSWAIKSLISLEPSISVLQMGSHLYACEHYIGIDQASYAPIDDVASIAETIKTLKGSEPSIQTVYLLSNSLVENNLRDQLNKTVPIQQMADDSDEEERMPAAVKEVLEFSFKTLSIPDYPVPVFALTKPTAEEVAEFGAVANDTAKAKEEDDDDLHDAELPKPAAPAVAAVTAAKLEEEPEEQEPEDEVEELEEEEFEDKSDATDAELETEDVLPTLAPPITAPITPEIAAIAQAEDDSVDYDEVSSESAAKEVPASRIKQEEKHDTKVKTSPAAVVIKDQDIDLRQFVGGQSKQETPAPIVEQPKTATLLPTIKNKSGVQNMLKMILITLAVFCLTVAVGVGVALAFLKYSGSQTPEEQTPVVQTETTPTPAPTATPEPTPAASESATTTPTNLKILVVNATTKAGYAGTFKSKIEGSKLGKVTATNAKGKYTDGGFIVYMKTQNAAAISTLEKAAGITTTFDESAKDEDPQGTYDLILVLAE